jgi:hypothetical protein
MPACISGTRPSAGTPARSPTSSTTARASRSSTSPRPTRPWKRPAPSSRNTVANGGNVLLVGTKRQAKDIVREAAAATNMPFCVDRWLGGTLTNYETVKKSIAKFKKYQQMETSGELSKLPRKEESAIKREMGRMQRNFNGIVEMGGLPPPSSSSTSTTRRSRWPRPPAAGSPAWPSSTPIPTRRCHPSDPRQRRRGQIHPDHRRDDRRRHSVRTRPARLAPRPARGRRSRPQAPGRQRAGRAAPADGRGRPLQGRHPADLAAEGRGRHHREAEAKPCRAQGPRQGRSGFPFDGTP